MENKRPNVGGATFANVTGASSCRDICTYGPQNTTENGIAITPSSKHCVENANELSSENEGNMLNNFCVVNRPTDYSIEND